MDVVLLQKGPAVQAIPGHVGHLQQPQRQVREAHHPLGLTLADAAQGGVQGGVGLSTRLHIGKARLDDVQVVLLGLGIQPLQGPGQKLVVGVQKGHVLPPGHLQAVVAGHAGKGIFLGEHHHPGITGGVLVEYLQAAVGGAVVHTDDLQVWDVLAQNPVQAGV